jgi:hypothetical protein
MSDDFRLQHSIKTQAGDMLNVRGATPAEFETALQYAEQNIERIVNLGALARAVGVAGDKGLTNPAPAQQYQSPQAPTATWGAPQTAQPPAPSCAHGAMTFRTSKQGAAKAWKAYFCPTPQGTPNQCEPQFLK